MRGASEGAGGMSSHPAKHAAGPWLVTGLGGCNTIDLRFRNAPEAACDCSTRSSAAACAHACKHDSCSLCTVCECTFAHASVRLSMYVCVSTSVRRLGACPQFNRILCLSQLQTIQLAFPASDMRAEHMLVHASTRLCVHVGASRVALDSKSMKSKSSQLLVAVLLCMMLTHAEPHL